MTPIITLQDGTQVEISQDSYKFAHAWEYLHKSN